MLGQLQMEVENFVLKMAAEFPHRKEQLIFLINNYDMMLGVITVSQKVSQLISDSWVTAFRIMQQLLGLCINSRGFNP